MHSIFPFLNLKKNNGRNSFGFPLPWTVNTAKYSHERKRCKKKSYKDMTCFVLFLLFSLVTDRFSFPVSGGFDLLNFWTGNSGPEARAEKDDKNLSTLMVLFQTPLSVSQSKCHDLPVFYEQS